MKLSFLLTLFFASLIVRAQNTDQFVSITGEKIDYKNYEIKIDEVIVCKQNDLYGLKDAEGKILLPIEFGELYYMGNGVTAAKKALPGISTNSSEFTRLPYIFYNKLGEAITDKPYFFDRDCPGFAFGSLKIKTTDSPPSKEGMILSNGIFIAPKFTYLSNEGNILRGLIYHPETEKSEYFIIDRATGKEKQLMYDRVEEYRDGLAAVKSDNKIGFINESGELVVPFNKADESYGFINGYAKLELKNKKFTIDRTGKKLDQKEDKSCYCGSFNYNGLNGVRDFSSSKINLIDPITKAQSGFIYEIVPKENDDMIHLQGMNLLKKGSSQFALIGTTGKAISTSVRSADEIKINKGVVLYNDKVMNTNGDILSAMPPNCDCMFTTENSNVALRCYKKTYTPGTSTQSDAGEKTYCVAFVLQKNSLFGFFVQFKSEKNPSFETLTDLARTERFNNRGLDTHKELYYMCNYGTCKEMKPKIEEKYALDDFVMDFQTY
jgi:hypothetical protein